MKKIQSIVFRLEEFSEEKEAEPQPSFSCDSNRKLLPACNSVSVDAAV